MTHTPTGSATPAATATYRIAVVGAGGNDWKKIVRDDELDKNLARMLHLDRNER